jgi:hypothetical protein
MESRSNSVVGGEKMLLMEKEMGVPEGREVPKMLVTKT